MPKEQLLYRRRAAAEMLDISPGMLDLLARQKHLRPIRVGRLPMYTRDELERFIRTRCGKGSKAEASV